MSAYNRRRTAQEAMPRIDVGDFVLYAVHKRDTKLDYVWRGPGVVLQKVSPMVYEVKPAGIDHAKPMDVHVCKLRRFAVASLNMTEQIRTDLARDHPDNVVAKLVGHDMSNNEVWFRCRRTVIQVSAHRIYNLLQGSVVPPFPPRESVPVD